MIITRALLLKMCNRIYNELGPYHTEITYKNAMEHELSKSGIEYNRERQISVIYDGSVVGHGYIDFLIRGKTANYPVEFKAISTNLFNTDGEMNKKYTAKKHHYQLIKYLQSLNSEKGFLINFNVGTKSKLEVLEIINPYLGDDGDE